MAPSSFSFSASQVASKAGLEADLEFMVDEQVLEFTGIEVWYGIKMLLASMGLAEESIMAAIEVAGEPMGFTRLE